MRNPLHRLELTSTALLAWLVLAPLAMLVLQTAREPSVWSVLVSREGSTVRQALATSVALSVATAALTTLLGGSVAAWVTRRAFALRTAPQLAMVLPLSLPPLVGVMSFLFLWGDVGLLQGAWRAWIDDRPPPPLQGFFAVLLVHVYSFVPLAFLLLREAFANLDADLDDAARVLGAGRLGRLVHVWWPQLRPAAAGAAWITFMASMASFSAPYLLGAGGRYLSTEIVARRLGGEVALAHVETLLLAGVSLLLLLLRPPMTRPSRGRRALARAARPALLHSIAAVVVLVGFALPHLTLLLLSFVRDGSWTWQPLPPAYTWDNHLGLFTSAATWRPLAHSLLMALPATVVGAVWATGVARAEVLGPAAARGWVRVAGSLPWAIPATALAMGWLVAFNRPTAAGLGLVLAATPFLLPVAYCLRFIPLQIRAASAVLQTRGALLEHTARTLGAGPWGAVWLVTWPVLRPALIGSSALVFVLATGEFVVSILLYVPENRPISLEILSELRLFNLGRAAALGVWLSLLLGAVLFFVPQAASSWNASSSQSR